MSTRTQPTHTPGPWTYRKHSDPEDAWRWAYWIDGVHELSGGKTPVCDVRNVGDDAEGNARLIAAAPDLLVACKVALSWATDEDAKSLGRHRDAFPGDVLRAALAAVRGAK